jgi:excisionase family DNA binding protein
MLRVETLCRTSELAAALGIPARAIVDMTRTGKIPCVWVGRRRRYGLAGLKAIMVRAAYRRLRPKGR